MSTASPLPLQPLPDAVVSALEQEGRRREVAERLAQHRRRRPGAQPMLPQMEVANPRTRETGVAASVAARFAAKASYRDLLAQEAEAATRQAEAVAEVARRNAEAIAAAQQRLLEDIAHWNTDAAPLPGPVEVATHTDSPVVLAEVFSFAEPAHVPAAQEFSAPAHSVAEPTPIAPQIESASPLLFADVLAEAMTSSASTAGTLHFDTHTPQDMLEPTTGLPTNLIEFPRQLVAARKARPRLAEGPLREEADNAPERAQLRIFEVEADTFSTVPLAITESVLPEWSSIRLDSWQAPHETASPDAQVTLALPLYTAPIEARCMAAAVDACCVGGTFLSAVAVAGYAAPQLPTGLMALGAAGGSLAMLSALYLAVFFTLTDATPGMRYARIALCTFNDDNPTRPAMRRRMLAMLLSLLPMGLGFLWALMDDDKLGWHDRVTRTYQRAY